MGLQHNLIRSRLCTSINTYHIEYVFIDTSVDRVILGTTNEDPRTFTEVTVRLLMEEHILRLGIGVMVFMTREMIREPCDALRGKSSCNEKVASHIRLVGEVSRDGDLLRQSSGESVHSMITATEHLCRVSFLRQL